MLAISDIHHALEPLHRVAQGGEPLLILGDLVNLIDYRSGEGAIADVLGIEFAHQAAAARATGDFDAMRQVWEDASHGNRNEMRAAITESLASQYRDVARVLAGARGFAIHGNVDRPKLLRNALPEGIEYVHGETRIVEGVTFGFIGGGVETPFGNQGEVTAEEMESLLGQFGPVDVLCTHIPPAIDPLRLDVITGRKERASVPILEYLHEHQPTLHLFGDVHQPQASSWRVGTTVCHNAGFFRATGRALKLVLRDSEVFLAG